MQWTDLFYFLLAVLLFWGSSACGRAEWNEDYTSLRQTKILQGIAALGVALHHMAQKTCAPWHAARYIVHGLDVFVPVGYLFVAVFFFCSGLGLYKSVKAKPDYLHGFARRRILPMVIAFYLSEFIHLLVRAAMGEAMGLREVLWYLTGLHMANQNAWYLIVIPFFYLVFYLAFRFSRSDRTAILWVTLAVLLYTLLGALIDHQSVWWMRGEWWYNTVILFPLGMAFGCHEQALTALLRRRYWFWLCFSLAMTVVLYRLSVLLTEQLWGYYGETWGDPLKVPHRLGCAVSQWLVCICFVTFCFLASMKLRLGNRALVFLGGMTLELYLMHGIFVELFGYSFYDLAPSLYYIRSVPLYILAVAVCSVPAALLFRLLWKRTVKVLLPEKKDAAFLG